MGKVILGLTMSLDGFAEDINGSVGALYPDIDMLKETDYMRESILTTGAVVMSKKEFDGAEDPDFYAEGYEYQVPIFVYTDKAPEKHPKETEQLTFTFVTNGVEEAIIQAKAAAVDRNVTIIGSAVTTPLCFNTGLVEELQVDFIPIFLKKGYRPFESIDHIKFDLERILVLELPAGRTHIRFRLNHRTSD